MSKVLKAVV
jgi:hypothetical protein